MTTRAGTARRRSAPPRTMQSSLITYGQPSTRTTRTTRTAHARHTHARTHATIASIPALAYAWVGVGAQIFTFEEGVKPKELRTLYSTSTQTLLSRSTLFSFVDGACAATLSPPFPSLLFYSQPPLTRFHRDGRCTQHRQAMTWPSADGSCWPLAPRPPTRYLLQQFL
jgi:hypothetical protein